jgi:hypothetical protein
MFNALIERFGDVQHITQDCNYKEIEGNIIIFYDIHSSHFINIEGIEKHGAIKYEYFNDPWQQEFTGTYQNGLEVHKLSPQQRSERAKRRGVSFIICPYENLYYRFIYPHFGDKLVWFPIAPSLERFKPVSGSPITQRIPKVLLSGNAWLGELGFKPYDFRRWAYKQPEPEKIEKDIPVGLEYPKFLSTYAGSLALCDTHICPKYSEIPMAGCVCFAQKLFDYHKMGFEDGKNCIYVTKGDFSKKIKDFEANIEDYQVIADSGRQIMESKWTARHFADAIYNHQEQKRGD